jgi:4-alpha-glucanotransferase
LMSLTALEAFRRKAMVIAEDLGTVPRGFREELARQDFRGMRVLWFERGPSGAFLPSRAWEPNACAMTSTHDLPTVVGWWRGRDIEWRERVAHKPNPSAVRSAKRKREVDRDRLWQTLKSEKCVTGVRPPPTQPNRILDGALRFVARSRSRIALFPLEDLAGALEQPNLPGTVSVHPNWRRRFAASALTSRQFSDRLALIAAERDAGDARLPRSP